MKHNLLAALAAAAFAAMTVPTYAADLGGTCCADLEERIAELEATTARKGNRKVTLTISGDINKAILSTSGDLPHNTKVIENSSLESHVVIAGTALITPNWKAGYVLDVGVGGVDDHYLIAPDHSNSLYTRQSFVWSEYGAIKLSLGHTSQATDGVAETSVVNTRVVGRMLSLRPINGPHLGEVADIFDGQRADLARVDIAILSGLTVSASWAAGDFGTKDVLDAAIRYYGEGGGFRYAGAIGYRDGIVIPTIGTFGSILGTNVKTLTASGSIQHIDTGLFVNGAYGHIDTSYGNIAAYHVQGGIEKKLWSPGKTTVFGEFADSSDLDLKLYGLGIVQAVDAAALDLYANVRKIEPGSGSATLFMVGAHVAF